MLEIVGVARGKIADEIGLEAGDKLISINSRSVNDCLDFTYFVSTGVGDIVNLVVKKLDGTLLDIDADIDGSDDLGLDLPPIEAARCKNKCVFCFVHQLPNGLRKSLYVKDEDFRLSFLAGNYVTLAKISKSDIERIKEQRLSPLYISVHSTNHSIRERLLGVRPDWEIIALMRELAAARIEMHAQIVVCPGINDGSDLERSIKELYALHPSLISLSIVPVGLTSHRSRLPDIKPVKREEALETISRVEELQKRSRSFCGGSFVFLADEYYLKAGLDVPGCAHYEDFPQIENGVGMLASFKEEAAEVLASAGRLKAPIRASVATGLSPHTYVEIFIAALNNKTGAKIRAYPVRNKLFGETVTVTGLLPGRDIIEQLRHQEIGECLFLPDVLLRDGDGSFIDDLTVGDIESSLNARVVTFGSTPKGFMEKINLTAGGHLI